MRIGAAVAKLLQYTTPPLVHLIPSHHTKIQQEHQLAKNTKNKLSSQSSHHGDLKECKLQGRRKGNKSILATAPGEEGHKHKEQK